RTRYARAARRNPPRAWAKAESRRFEALPFKGRVGWGWVSPPPPRVQSSRADRPNARRAAPGPDGLGRDGSAATYPAGIADISIHIASHTWPSGSARLRLYMKPRSCFGLMSAVPPFEAAASFMASTASRLSSEIASSTSLEVEGGIGRLVN